MSFHHRVSQRPFVATLATAILIFAAACGTDASHLMAPGAGAASLDRGNSAAAFACQNGGYANLVGSDGTTFTNTGECVSYAARGGTLRPKNPPPTIVDFSYAGTAPASLGWFGGAPSNCVGTFNTVFSGGTGVLTGPNTNLTVTSGQTYVAYAAPGFYTLTVTNADGLTVSQTIYTLGPQCPAGAV